MSELSNNNGRAFEYIFINTLNSEIEKRRPSNIIKDKSYHAAENAWVATDENLRNDLFVSAKAGVSVIFSTEPMILENDGSLLQLYIQPDERGQEGDVRDIIITRENIQWEIGLSLKHNHFAVKHCRLSNHIDFCNNWFGYNCTNNYWSDIKPIFDFLKRQQEINKKWEQLPTKETCVYKPLLEAFIKELNVQLQAHSDVPTKMVEYLLGKFDFYKVISVDAHRLTEVQGFNLHGTLNKPSKNNAPKIVIPRSSLPKRFLYIGFYKNRNNTVEICMDEGWHFTFRIHNASTFVEPSLKFDVQIIGIPTTIITINSSWL